MKAAGLVAGIGGLERGLAAAGHEPALLCEIWDPARAVLEAGFPKKTRCLVTSPNSAPLPDGIHLLVAGFPCQDLS